MKAPVIVYLILVIASLCMTAKLHGEPKTGNHNFWIILISTALNAGLMYWGGFFN